MSRSRFAVNGQALATTVMARSWREAVCVEDGVRCHPAGSFTHSVKFSLPIPIGRMTDGEVGVSWPPRYAYDDVDMHTTLEPCVQKEV